MRTTADMKRQIILSMLATAGGCHAAQAALVADETSFIQCKQQWSELITPSISFGLFQIFFVVLSIVGIALYARSKVVPIRSPAFLVPVLVLALVLWIFARAPASFAKMYGDFGVRLPGSSLGWMPFFLGSRWYGPLFICGVWMLAHPIVLRPRAPISRRRGVLLFLPLIGVMFLIVTWFFRGAMSPCFRM